jgi:hypothetical protein
MSGWKKKYKSESELLEVGLELFLRQLRLVLFADLEHQFPCMFEGEALCFGVLFHPVVSIHQKLQELGGVDLPIACFVVLVEQLLNYLVLSVIPQIALECTIGAF